MRFTTLLAVAVLTAGLFLCRTAPAGDRVVYVYTWEGYFCPEAIREFERRHDCAVDFTYYDSNDAMLETILHEGGYDVATPSASIAAILFRSGRLRRLDHALLPNLKNIDRDSPALAQDPDMVFGVPYTVTVTGIAYNRNKIPADAARDWSLYDDARLTGAVTMFNEEREVLGAALKHLGHGINSVDAGEIRAAGRIVADWKRNIAMFEVELAKEGLRKGELAAAQSYSGDAAALMRDNPDIDFFVPAGGSALNADVLAIMGDSKNVSLAHAFVDFFLEADIARMNMEYTDYVMPNAQALKSMDPAWLASPARTVPSDILDKCEVIMDVGDARDMYDEVWVKVLLGNG